ncbi:AbgT family transporter [Arthrobacter sp. ATA002]|nr:AbgT family transporter [Arthrobacter sp. ATA002]WAP52600.1 AbgT family transporter [Arthrobacter sp. ATA002]
MLNSPVIGGMAFVIGLFFAVIGVVYGRSAGTFTSGSDVTGAMIEGIKSMAPILVLFFAISQFLAYFKWTGMGEVLAISGHGPWTASMHPAGPSSSESPS